VKGNSSRVIYHLESFSKWLTKNSVLHTVVDREDLLKNLNMGVKTMEWMFRFDPSKNKIKLYKLLLEYLILNAVLFDNTGFMISSVYSAVVASVSIGAQGFDLKPHGKPISWLVSLRYITVTKPSIYDMMKNNISKEMERSKK
jgi:hypothetical protein